MNRHRRRRPTHPARRDQAIRRVRSHHRTHRVPTHHPTDRVRPDRRTDRVPPERLASGSRRRRSALATPAVAELRRDDDSPRRLTPSPRRRSRLARLVGAVRRQARWSPPRADRTARRHREPAHRHRPRPLQARRVRRCRPASSPRSAGSRERRSTASTGRRRRRPRDRRSRRRMPSRTASAMSRTVRRSISAPVLQGRTGATNGDGGAVVDQAHPPPRKVVIVGPSVRGRCPGSGIPLTRPPSQVRFDLVACWPRSSPLTVAGQRRCSTGFPAPDGRSRALNTRPRCLSTESIRARRSGRRA